jgi:arylsulfatase
MSGHGDKSNLKSTVLNRRNILLAGTTIAAATAIATASPLEVAQAQQQPAAPSRQKPNILVIFGDDIGLTNISAYSMGLMGYRTPNIDRIAKEGMIFTDYYAEQSCTAGRSSFITGQATLRTGLSKVGGRAIFRDGPGQIDRTVRAHVKRNTTLLVQTLAA